MVRQEHAAVLREGLARLAKFGHPSINEIVNDSLLRYAAAIAPYCKCPQRAFVQKEGKFACLDCGRRYQRETGKDFSVIPPEPKAALNEPKDTPSEP